MSTHRRKCKCSPDSFCYIRGQFPVVKQRLRENDSCQKGILCILWNEIGLSRQSLGSTQCLRNLRWNSLSVNKSNENFAFEFQWSGASSETMWTIFAPVQHIALQIKRSTTCNTGLGYFASFTFNWNFCTKVWQFQRFWWSNFVICVRIRWPDWPWLLGYFWY